MIYILGKVNYSSFVLFLILINIPTDEKIICRIMNDDKIKIIGNRYYHIEDGQTTLTKTEYHTQWIGLTSLLFKNMKYSLGDDIKVKYSHLVNTNGEIYLEFEW